LSVVVHDLLPAVQQSLCRSPGGAHIAGHLVELRLDLVGS